MTVATDLHEILRRARELGFLGPGPVSSHVEHALGQTACVPAGAARCLDLGSGGGLPGLVLVQARPELRVVLLEARERRCRFLREAVEELGLTDRVDVVEERAETAARRSDLREALDVVVARSFGPPAVTAECAVGFLRLGGLLVVSEPPAKAERPRWDESGLGTLGLGPPACCDGAGGTFVRLEKVRLDERWPRRVGLPAKRPCW